MKFNTNILLSLAIAVMAIAINLPDPLTSAPVTVTMTEQACMNGCAGEATPLSLANALATAADVSAAVSLIASVAADSYHGDIEDPQPEANTTTVTTVASATKCPAAPTFDLSPAMVWSVVNGDLNGTAAENTNANGTEAPAQNWSQGRNSLCFTDSSSVSGGHYYSKQLPNPLHLPTAPKNSNHPS
ncbi:hypothetical protein UCDDA912_g07418 [Diaporthe ampelina]|uniref:Secreted protein n=1 Tax=Diaporthe ampelina TaxID=1214573 RepID=A0A0G2HXB3_9PEZI|nr:hypothetical protein UCDDA912_g07418 [Diaporthe ampelina]